MTLSCAIIPARAGSKGVPGKNIRPVYGHPMIAYSIVAAKACKEIDRVIVTTDCQEIADLAKTYGAEVPFLRPQEMAGDLSPAIDFMAHAVEQLAALDDYHPDSLVMLLPTTPLRDPKIVDQAIILLNETDEATGLRSAHELAEPPQKMMGINEDGFLCGLYPNDPRPEYFNLPRQAFPPAYHPNGYVEIIRRETLIDEGKLYGPKIQAFITPHIVEIDTQEEFDYLEFFVDHHGHPLVDVLNDQFGSDDRIRKG